MNKTLAHKIIAISLALLVLIASFSFAIEVHFCQGNAKSLGVFNHAKNCAEMMADKAAVKSCHQNKTTTKSCAKDCCNNTTLQIDSSLDQTTVAPNQTINFKFQPLTAIIIAVVQFVVPHLLHLKTYSGNLPPLLNIDVPIFIQSFLL